MTMSKQMNRMTWTVKM